MARRAHMPAPSLLARRDELARRDDAHARLGLTEFLLAVEDRQECAQGAARWLARHAGTERVLVAAALAEPTRLTGLAGHGLPPAAISSFSLDLDDRAHPLVRVLDGRGPSCVPAAELAGYGIPRALVDAGPVTVMPFSVTGATAPHSPAMLLASPSPSLAPTVRWAVDALAIKLSTLSTMHALRDASRQVERERRLLSTVLDATPDPVLLTGTDGRMIVASARAEQLFAARDEESEGRRRAVALNNMLFSAALSQRALSSAGLARRELFLVDPVEGTDLVFELLSAEVRDPREGTGVVSILRDVSDLRRVGDELEDHLRRLRVAEAHTRAERDRLNLIIDSVADPVLVTDLAGNIVLMNDNAERLFAPNPATPSGEKAVRSNDTQLSAFVSSALLHAQPRWRGELAVVHPDSGASLPMEAVSGKLVSAQGELTGVVTILHDRSEALERARLEQASALKSQFLANVSHEFRTPLNAILGYTSMLLEGVPGPPSPPQVKTLERVDSNAKHLLALIDDLLDISRIEAGRMPLRVGSFRVRDLVGEVVREVEPLIARSGLAVRAELPAGLPLVRSDRQKVKQIVLNLLTNALKFTPSGSVTVAASYQQPGDAVAIRVTDTGIGIAEADRERVFEAFRQADSSPTRQYGGTGLGLAICRRLSVMLGGDITLTSVVGAGSTFTLSLPRRPPGRNRP